MLDDEWIARANCKTMTIDKFISKFINNADEAAIIFEAFSSVEIDENKTWAQAEVQKYASLFFELYEEDTAVADIVDKNVCLTCPVIKDCFVFGTEEKQDGVWGGVYLLEGDIVQARNAHKTEETWEKILEAVRG